MKKWKVVFDWFCFILAILGVIALIWQAFVAMPAFLEWWTTADSVFVERS